MIKSALIGLLGLLGALGLVWVALSLTFGLAVTVFLTGSMSPTLPAGAAAVVVNDVPAAELEVGDIVTVPRPGEVIPVTHRIRSIEMVTGSDTARSLTLQGDANDTPDTGSYEVTSVPRVLFGFAGAGTVILTLQTPLFMGGITLLATLVAVWAFWPARRLETEPDEPALTRVPV
jgi:signal peptidase